ncbi:MAG: hypothetical protein ACKVVP_24160 [Chloroflexota bacterium]
MSINEPRPRTDTPDTLPRTDVPSTLPRTETRPSYTSPARRHYTETDRDMELEAEIQPASNLFRDRVRWGPIIAGVSTALTSLLMLSLLGLAVGLTTVNAGTAAATGALPENTGTTAAVWGAVSAIIAFFLGGFMAGRTASVFSRGWGALNGAMVFLIGIPFMLWLAGQGLGSVIGGLSGYAGDLANQAQNTAQNTSPVEVARTASQIRNGAWGSLLGAILGLGAAALGGSAGTRRHIEMDADTGRIHD